MRPIKPTKTISKKVEKPKEEIRFETGQSSLGAVLVASSIMGIVSIILRRDAARLVPELESRFPKAHIVRGTKYDRGLVKAVIKYIEKPIGYFNLPLDIRGTIFQQRVWSAVRKIPVGQTSNYSEIAEKISAARAVRAVGSTCSNNHFSIIIPCHRVLHKDGSLSGGNARSNAWQRAILDHEAAVAASVK